jgi:hypothetical protein
MKTLSFALVAVLSLALFAGCGSDKKTTPGTDTVEEGTTDTVQEAAPETVVVGPQHFRGKLIDFQTKAGIAGAKVYILNNDTGEPLDGYADPFTSGADDGGTAEVDEAGFVDIDFDGTVGTTGELLGFKVVMDGQKDTYQYHLPANTKGGDAGSRDTLWSVSVLTYNVAPPLAGLTVDPEKSIMAGGVYFELTDINGDGELDEQAVGCSIAYVPSQDAAFNAANVRYFGASGLPTTLTERDSVNPETPYYLINAIPEGKVEVEARMGDKVLGKTYIFSHKDSINIGNIFVDKDLCGALCDDGAGGLKNPMPDACE